MTGALERGETLMVIGKPGSGCTTFLKALANKREEYAAVEGKVLYNGVHAADLRSRRPGEVAFSGEMGTGLRFRKLRLTMLDRRRRCTLSQSDRGDDASLCSECAHAHEDTETLPSHARGCSDASEAF